MSLRPLIILVAAMGSAWAADFDPASYQTLHFVGEIHRSGEVDLSTSSTYCRSLAPVPGKAVLPPSPPPAPSGARLDPQPASNATVPGAATAPAIATTNPHDGGKVRYYLNDLAAGAKDGRGQDGFPIGAIIVKEKWHFSGDAEPTVITVMEKLSAAREVSSWSFRMYDCATHQDLTAAYLEQAATSCVDCHARWQSTGFVSPQGFALIRKPLP